MDIKQWAKWLLDSGYPEITNDEQLQVAHRRVHDPVNNFRLEIMFRWDSGDAVLTVDLDTGGDGTLVVTVIAEGDKPRECLEETLEKAVRLLS